MRYFAKARILLALVIVLCTTAAPLFPVMVAAEPKPVCPNDDPSHCIDAEDLYSAQINTPWADPRLQIADDSGCTATTASVGASFTGFQPDPGAVSVYNTKMKDKIAKLAPLYQQAAKEEKVADWEVLAGVHEIEHGLSRTNVTNAYGFMTPFQMGAAEIRGAGGDPNDPRLASGHTLTDDEFVYVARLSLRILKGKARDNNVAVDMSQPMSPKDIARVTIAYNTGQGTVSVLKDTSPYAWAGWNNGSFKLPTYWAGGNTYNQANPLHVPGAVTTVGLIRAGGNIGSTPGDSIGSTGCVGSGAPSSNTAPSYCKDGSAAGSQKIVCYAFLFDHYDYNDPGCRGSADKLNTFGPHQECKDIKGVQGLLDAVKNCNDTSFGSACTIPKFSPIIDCSSLVDAAVFGGTGIDLGGAATGAYPSNSHLQEIQKTEAKPGDIVWFDGHTEVIVLNNTEKKHFDTFGAHEPNGPDEGQVGPSGYDYSKVPKVFRAVP